MAKPTPAKTTAPAKTPAAPAPAAPPANTPAPENTVTDTPPAAPAASYLFLIRGKMADGRSISAELVGPDAPTVVGALAKKVAAHGAILSLTVKERSAGGEVKIKKPRAKKVTPETTETTPPAE